MTPERLLSLIEAYGAEPAYWPREWRAEAEAVARSGDPTVARALQEARAIDAELSSHSIGPVDDELICRIVASGPASPWWRVAGRRARWWLSGVVLVGAGVGGVAAGALTISLILPVSSAATAAGAEGSSVATAFGDVGAEGGER